MSYQFDKWTDEELVDHYREMSHLPVDVNTSKGVGDLAYYQSLVREMARRFADMVEAKEEPEKPEEAADAKKEQENSEK